jgi:hypothetical protein
MSMKRVQNRSSERRNDRDYADERVSDVRVLSVGRVEKCLNSTRRFHSTAKYVHPIVNRRYVPRGSTVHDNIRKGLNRN